MAGGHGKLTNVNRPRSMHCREFPFTRNHKDTLTASVIPCSLCEAKKVEKEAGEKNMLSKEYCSVKLVSEDRIRVEIDPVRIRPQRRTKIIRIRPYRSLKSGSLHSS